MKASTAAFLAVNLVALAFAGCGSSGKPGEVNPKTPLAEVNGKKITVADVEERLERLPRLARAEFTGEKGRERMVQRMVEEGSPSRADRGIERERIRRARGHAPRNGRQAYLEQTQSEASASRERSRVLPMRIPRKPRRESCDCAFW